MPIGNGDLAGQDGGASVVTILADLEEVTTLALSQGRHGEVVDDEDIDTGQLCQPFVQGTVGASHGEFSKELRLAGIEGCVALADGLLGEGTGQKGFTHTAGAKQDEVVMSGEYLKSGKLPSECRPERTWRTRPDPYESVWPEVEGILKRSPTVEATTVFDHLNRVHEGKFEEGQLRTLQRHIKQWRARNGELKEVMFPQRHEPGHQAQSDFTFMNSLGMTIAGQPFPHLLYHFVLTYSNWETTTLCFSESFESLTLGVQNAIWELGAVPAEHRTDRLSAAVNNLKKGVFTRRYQTLLDHYGMKWSRTQAGKAHENGDVEQAHHRLKRAIEQELLLRGSRDFLERDGRVEGKANEKETAKSGGRTVEQAPGDSRSSGSGRRESVRGGAHAVGGTASG